MRAAPEELLDQVRAQAVAFLAAVPHPPKVLRLRAGAVALDAEWPADPAPTAPAEHDRAPEEHDLVTAPTVGVFYAAPEPGAPPFVRPGDVVTAGQQVAIVEAMKVMIPVEAGHVGRVVEVLKRDGEPVAYGEALFALAPEGHDDRPAAGPAG